MVKVADFGLARQFEELNSHTSKADVYSYGMVLLELVRGFPEREDDGESLVEWAYQFISSNQEGNIKKQAFQLEKGTQWLT